MNLAEKRNHGASLIQSDFLLFSDDDDIWHQERGELVIKALEGSPVCCHNYGKFGSDSGDALNKLGNYDVNVTRNHLLFGANVFGGGSAMAVRKDIVELFPFTRSYSFCEDFQWWVRLIFAGIHIKYIGKPLVFYRTHSTNMTRALMRISYYSLMVSKEVFLRAIFMLLVSVLIALRATAKFALGWFFSIKK
jgi:glycosyltransferase involved in cell wall biosynthesis